MFPNGDTTYIGRVADKRSSRASAIYNTIYQEMGLNALFLQFGSTDSASVASSLKGLGFRGSVVVGCHAKGILPYLDEVDDHARRAGSVNTLVVNDMILRGYKTDGPALIDSIEEVTTLNGKRVVILGAGKLVREISYLLLLKQVREVIIYNRTIEKAKQLCSDTGFTLGGSVADLAAASGDVFINATDVGAAWCDTKDVFPLGFVDRFHVVMDVTFTPFSTRLQENATRLEKIVVPGWRMFAHQGARQTALFFGVQPPLDRLCELIKAEFSA